MTYSYACSRHLFLAIAAVVCCVQPSVTSHDGSIFFQLRSNHSAVLMTWPRSQGMYERMYVHISMINSSVAITATGPAATAIKLGHTASVNRHAVDWPSESVSREYLP